MEKLRKKLKKDNVRNGKHSNYKVTCEEKEGDVTYGAEDRKCSVIIRVEYYFVVKDHYHFAKKDIRQYISRMVNNSAEEKIYQQFVKT